MRKVEIAIRDFILKCGILSESHQGNECGIAGQLTRSSKSQDR